ncbi:MAG: 4Fe-4S binding protein [Thermoplasmata archaeon]
MVKIEINGTIFETEKGKTVLEVANDNKIKIPTLCHQKALPNYGACRLCIVEILKDGWSLLVTACTLPVKDGMRVLTDSEDVQKSRKMTIELLLARSPEEEVLIDLAKEYGVGELRFKKKDDNCILCGLCVRMCERMGREAINFQGRGIDRELGTPYLELSDVCMTCGACAFICPTSRFTQKKVERISGNKPIPILSEFDRELTQRKPVYIPYPQAIPLIPVIDKDKCIYYQTGNCKTCSEFCEAKAIEYDQEDEIKEIDVGAIIVSSGFTPVDPKIKSEYGYGRYDNVLTSLEFERVLSASGPFAGKVLRPKDRTTPKRIAWIQCVGSRDEQKGKPYCSAVCCRYATKEAIIAKDHEPDIDTTIFYMDLRTFGKGGEEYYNKAKDEYGVNYVRCRIPHIEEIPETKNLKIIYRDENWELKEEIFDLVILAMAMEPHKDWKELAEMLGVDLDEYGFCDTGYFTPQETSRSGIYVGGSVESPKDIPDSVAQASGAASKAMDFVPMYEGRKEEGAQEIEIGEEPRIGVFSCHCGVNIGSVVDVPGLVEFSKTLPNVVHADEDLYICSQASQDKIKDAIKEHNLNRVVVASCTPRTHEPLFQKTIKEMGLNEYLFDLTSTREHCSWVHKNDPEKATEKAKHLVAMAVEKVMRNKVVHKSPVDCTNSALIIGGGIAGMTAALDLADKGFKAYIVEKEKKLGGNLNNVYYLLTDDDPQIELKAFLERIDSNPNIEVFPSSSVQNVGGYIGNFTATISHGGEKKDLNVGTIIVATGATELKPKGLYMYGEDPRVMTQLEFEKKLHEKGHSENNVVMIQCTGSREEGREYCSRICCSMAVKNALKIKELKPNANVYVLYRDVRTYGLKEKFYREARSKGVVFIRYEKERKPVVEKENENLKVTVYNPNIKKHIVIRPDYVVLSSSYLPSPENEQLAKVLKVPLTKDNFFMESHLKIKPVEFAVAGVFLCGGCHSPKFMDEAISQASGTAARALTILSKEQLLTEGVAAVVDEERCTGCGLCQVNCPYEAIKVNEETGVAEVNEVLCMGCGACSSICPSNVPYLRQFEPSQLMAMVDKALEAA